MDILSLIPKQALVFVFILIVGIIAAVVALLKKNQSPPASQQGIPTQTFPVNNQTNPIPSDPINVSPELAKPDEGKYVAIIFAVATMAILIPLVSIIIVKNQKSQEMVKTSAGLTKSSTCNAITITDTLGTVLSETALQDLRPNDEVKILIATSGDNITKARFRVNGSEWQESTIKEASNFIGNYILTSGTNKFTVEAEVFDQEKGWL